MYGGSSGLKSNNLCWWFVHHCTQLFCLTCYFWLFIITQPTIKKCSLALKWFHYLLKSNVLKGLWWLCTHDTHYNGLCLGHRFKHHYKTKNAIQCLSLMRIVIIRLNQKKINNNNLIMRFLHILTWSTITLARTYSLAKGYGTSNS